MNRAKLFEEKVILITGGSLGIGRTTALALAGTRIVVGNRRLDEGAAAP